MKEKFTVFVNTGFSKLVFILSISTALFWTTSQIVNIYRFKLVGAIFEILWLPFLTMLFVLPILSFIFLIKQKFNLRSLFVYSLLIIGVTILMMVLIK